LNSINTLNEFEEFLKLNKATIHYKNRFLEIITQKLYLQTWVDIENEYYKALKECIANKYNGGIDKLNQDFKQIKHALESYLININSKLHEYTLDFPIKDILKKIYSLAEIPSPSETILFLNFNYTSTHNFYLKGGYKSLYEELKIAKTESIQIHGKLGNNSNPIIFGYGDEKDDEYSVIEKLNDNEYLENIKSFKYSETDNYKKLLNFINSSNYQIFIMGHSCGISDRTLLNTLFEHDNCVSIKVFYHKKEDETDNYSDMIKNISRNFTNKATMRDKVVNKMDCEPLLTR
jgi:hypothetical protein